MNSIFLKLSFRKLLKNKTYSVSTLLGLTVGFTAFILIALFVRYELNWDKSHEYHSRIYRVQRRLSNALYASNGSNISPHTRAITAQMIEGKFPEFEKVTVTRTNGSAFLAADAEHLVHDEEGIYADTHFFELFTYHFIEGDKASALNQPYTIVLSETLAKKTYFLLFFGINDSVYSGNKFKIPV